jgi:hypothetical protein
MRYKEIKEGGMFDNYEKRQVLRCSPVPGDPVRLWGDGSFIAYPQQSGVPYNFERIDE